MPISAAIDEISLDELAIILLPVPVRVAIDAVDIEVTLWKRRRCVTAVPHHATRPATLSPHERVLPVVVLGEMVMPPLVSLVVAGEGATQPRTVIPNRLLGIRPGRSYRAIEAARDSDHEIVVIFVPEREIAGYKSSEPQPLPVIGVIARLVDVVSHADGTLEVALDVTTRATITARLQHDPFYRVACVPQPDTDVTDPTIQALMAAVKARASAVAPTVPKLTPAQVEQALTFINQIEHPGQLADFVTYSPSFTFADKLALLNTLDPVERLRLVARTLGV